ncbi:HNH endonuclease [Streptomyces phaeolivaceus]|uniref:HNH endonuclease n=1 Tax=Streptomyces phaeolivaceus TaxID=2653200 RepID=A0A5P8K5J8_9ACTN|nr:HNH endonuclease [Streptomyces phaeolivaceus]QFQ98361.1 HNH endonuclease [Streptomyces phaeolivaceus]
MARTSPHLNSERRRLRKRQLSKRFGRHCAYCRRPFTTLRDATLDHVVPYSLWRTWSVTALVLACWDCNHRKGDRFPLSIALLICATLRSTGVNTTSTPVNPTVDAPTVHVDGPAFTAAHDVFTAPFTLDIWRLLARLAHANQPTFAAVWSPDPTGRRSTPDQPRSTCHGRREQRPSARPNCLRAPRPVRTCAGPTGEAVPA